MTARGRGQKPAAVAFTTYKIQLGCGHPAVFTSCPPGQGDLVFCRSCCDYQRVAAQEYSRRGWGARRPESAALPAPPATG